MKLNKKLIGMFDKVSLEVEPIRFEIDGEVQEIEVSPYFARREKEKMASIFKNLGREELEEVDNSALGSLIALLTFTNIEIEENIEDNLKIVYVLADLGVLNKIFEIVGEVSLEAAINFMDAIKKEVEKEVKK